MTGINRFLVLYQKVKTQQQKTEETKNKLNVDISLQHVMKIVPLNNKASVTN